MVLLLGIPGKPLFTRKYDETGGMSDNYTVEISFRNEDLSGDEYDALISELGSTDEGVDITERKREQTFSANSIEGAAVDLSTVSLLVSTAGLLLNLYQMARTNPPHSRILHPGFFFEGNVRL